MMNRNFLLLSILVNIILAGFLGYQFLYKPTTLPKTKIFQANYPIVSELNDAFAVNVVVISANLVNVTDTTLTVLGLDKKEHQLPLDSRMFVGKIGQDGRTPETKLTLEDLKKAPKNTYLVVRMGYNDEHFVIRVQDVKMFLD